MSQSDNHDRLPSVVHVVSYFPPDRIGGVGEHVKVIHEGHLALGLDSSVITSGTTQSAPLVNRVGRTPFAFFIISWRLYRLVRDRDVVQVHHGEGLLLALLTRIRRSRPRVLTMFHVDVRKREKASGPHDFNGRRFGPAGPSRVTQRLTGVVKGLADWFVWLLADAVVVETNAVKAEVSTMRPARPITVIPHGLGPSPEIGIVHDPVELLYVGTPGVRKRTHLLPSILDRVRQSVPDARLRIVGFGPDRDPDLYTEAERLGVLEAIEFVGPVRNEEVLPFYRASQVLVLPSAYEGLPMVLLEAMREGLVPVATNVSGHPEAIKNGANGYLVDLDDVEAMSARCAQLLAGRSIAAEMSRRARYTIEAKFSLKAELDSYLNLCQSLLEA